MPSPSESRSPLSIVSTHPVFNSRRPSVVSTLPNDAILALSPRSPEDEGDIYPNIFSDGASSGVVDEIKEGTSFVDGGGVVMEVKGASNLSIDAKENEAALGNEVDNVISPPQRKDVVDRGFVVVEREDATMEDAEGEQILSPDFVKRKHHNRKSWALQKSHRVRSSTASIDSPGDGGVWTTEVERTGHVGGSSMLSEWFGMVMEKCIGGGK